MAGLYEGLERVLLQKGEAAVIEWEGQSITGSDLLDRVEKAAHVLSAHGVSRGDRVLVQAEKSLAIIYCYFATLRQGAIFVPLNTGYRLQEFTYFLNDSSPALVICDPANEQEYSRLVERNGACLLTLGANGEGSFAEYFDRADTPVRAVSVDNRDLAALIYTSGTTGRSKGAMLSHANLISNAMALGQIWGVTQNDLLVHALPLFHVHGLFISLNTVLLAGARVRLLPRFDVSSVLDALPGATLFMGVPTYYVRLLANERFSRKAASDLRLCISGSAPLLMETFDAFEARMGMKLLERYGMSECGIICSNRPDRIARGTVGPPLPGVELQIADETGAPLAAGEVGSVEVRGDGVFSGYWQMPEKTKAEFRSDGFFITGDLGKLDANGNLHLVGRAKDMVISGGLNVYPSEIEAVIDACPGVDESAVIGVPHADFGEAVIAVVCLRQGLAGDGDAIIGAVKEKLAGYKVPKAVLFADELPRNTMGKVEKAALRAEHAALFAEVKV